MKIFTRLFLLVFVIVALSALFVIPSAATTGPVLYVSSSGKGQGYSPNDPLGNSEGYVPDNKDFYKGNALLRALYELQPTGGTIVIVGPTSLDTCTTNTNVQGKSAAELDVPSNVGVSTNDADYNTRPTIRVTSVYGGVDYRTQGAKLILDHAECCSGNLRLKSPGIWKDLNIEYRYDPLWLSYYNTGKAGIVAPYMIEADHTKQVFDTGINCTSVLVHTLPNGEKIDAYGDIYPMIIGGHRQATRRGHNTDITIKSGTWSYVSAAGYGHSPTSTNSATVDGNAKLTVEGGKIGEIYGAGSIYRAYGTVKGRIDITVTGGEIGNVWLTNGEIYTGPGIKMTVNNANITGGIYHSPIEGEVLPEVTVLVNGYSYTPPSTLPPEFKPSDSETAETKPIIPIPTEAPPKETIPQTTIDVNAENVAPDSPSDSTTFHMHIVLPVDETKGVSDASGNGTEDESPRSTAEDDTIQKENDTLSIVVIIISSGVIMISVLAVVLTILTKKGIIKW